MADSKEEQSWFSGAWDWTRNSLLGRTIGIDDATKAGKESKGLWGETKDLLSIDSSKETDEKGAAKQTESKGLWSWMKNSMLGRTFGLADEGNKEPGLWGTFKETVGLSNSGNNEQKTGGAWGWMKNSLLGRTFGLQDEGNKEPGLWGWMKNSMLGRTLGLADKKEAPAKGAAQQAQAPQQKTATVNNQQTTAQQMQKTSNGAVNDDVIVEHSTVNAPKAAAKAAAPKAAAQKAQAPKAPTPKEPGLEGSGAKAAAEVTAAPRPPVTPSHTVPSGFEYEKFNSQTIDFGSSSYTLGGNNLSSKDVSDGLGLLTAARNNGLTLNPDGSYNAENEQIKTSGSIQITLTGGRE